MSEARQLFDCHTGDTLSFLRKQGVTFPRSKPPDYLPWTLDYPTSL
jgi:nitrate reductase assembly molybdenum cofactor insertion protein NarJ